MGRILAFTLILMLTCVTIQGQNKMESVYKKSEHNIQPRISLNPSSKITGQDAIGRLNTSSHHLSKSHIWTDATNTNRTQIVSSQFQNNKPIWLNIKASKTTKSIVDPIEQSMLTINDLSYLYHIKDPSKELVLVDQKGDLNGKEHVKFKQYYKGIEVHGAELRAHFTNSVISSINGHSYPTPDLDITPSLKSGFALSKAQTDHGDITSVKAEHLHLIGGQQSDSELIIYHNDKKATKATLAYKVTLYPNLAEKWLYFIDAHSGEIIHKYKDSCKLYHNHNEHVHNSTSVVSGPDVAIETGLSGQNVSLNVFEDQGTYYLLNVNEKMFNSSLSVLPNEPVGGILTLDALNTSPQNDDFVIDHVTSSNNRWNNPIATSAHANAAIVYKYFEDKFERISFDKAGSTIYSMINVSEEDGSGMDNAFWNGIAMFYGNGNQAFDRPLAAALDVAAHEFSHGVIQHEANLAYENESGALNESFADIFGVLVDRDDWTLGEEVVNTNIFRTGALRSLSDPNNGGRSLNDTGWQPKTVSEQFRGPEDNGGVHINSGIPNYAFYLFASNSAVGLDVAEAVYYKAISDYLVSTSGFTDLRLSIEQSIIDLYGNNGAILNAFNNAFDAVGINSTGGALPTGEPEVYSTNSGEDFVIWYDEANDEMNIRTISQSVDNVISRRGLYNTPSASDDGSVIVFIGLDQNMYALTIDWTTGTVNEVLIDDQIKWRNAAISKDGTKIAAVDGDLAAGEFNNDILIYNFVSGASQWFELSNPTTAEGVNTGDVLFADAMEWDITGEYVMYDASNQIISLFNDPINYWDIGFIQAWDNSIDGLADGRVFKLFPSLPENVSIGNPTFAKNSSDIIAFDLIDGRSDQTEYSILGVNLVNGEQGLIFQNSTLGFPNYNSKDDAVIFNASTNTGSEVIGIVSVDNDFITGENDAAIFLSDATWGVWFNNGQRDLSTATNDPIISDNDIVIKPNPVKDQLVVSSASIKCTPCDYQIYNIEGQLVQSGTIDQTESPIDVSGLGKGLQQLLLQEEGNQYSIKFVKL